MEAKREALLELGRRLARGGYPFVTPTPETHRRVLARKGLARDLRDVFGWSCPFSAAWMDPTLLSLLREAGECADEAPDRCRARVRFATLGGGLYVHSAYPTVEDDAVFFGPDTYRFCAFVAREAPPSRFVVDVGCGAGAGGMVAARASGAAKLSLADVNARALSLAEVNARLAGLRASIVRSDVLAAIEGQPDLIVTNPPFMRDTAARTYRDGGGAHGEALSLRILRESLERLAPGGTLLLYTGAPVVEGRDVFFEAARPMLEGRTYAYRELDPDIFGEALDDPGYERVERIAAVGLRVRGATR